LQLVGSKGSSINLISELQDNNEVFSRYSSHWSQCCYIACAAPSWKASMQDNDDDKVAKSVLFGFGKFKMANVAIVSNIPNPNSSEPGQRR
jgi:hypothetical protein